MGEKILEANTTESRDVRSHEDIMVSDVEHLKSDKARIPRKMSRFRWNPMDYSFSGFVRIPLNAKWFR